MSSDFSEALLPSQKKAKCHRRRYAPVGPAGVLFQAQREQQLNAKNNGAPVGNSMNEETTHEEERGIEFSQNIVENTKAPTAGVVFYSRAWVDMLCQLQIVTPMLRAYLSEEQRYTTIRRFMPPKFIMVPEILRGQVDWKLPPGKYLLVVVHAIDARSDTLWVAELLDETGSKISAWIKPRFVEQEQKAPKYVRIGMVWMLKDVTVVLDSSPGRGVVVNNSSTTGETNNDNEYKRMILVGEPNIESVWSPPSNEEDTDTASDPRFIEWMEKRNTLTSSLEAAAADDCDLDLLDEDEENIPIDTDRSLNVVREDRIDIREHLPEERESRPRSHDIDDIDDDDSNDFSAHLTDFVEATTHTRSPIDPPTVRGNDQVNNDPPRNNDRQYVSSSPTTRKRKDAQRNNDLNQGLWTIDTGEELAGLSCDDDDDGPRQAVANANEREDDSQLRASPAARERKTPAGKSIFQNADYVTLDLDCSSDEDN